MVKDATQKTPLVFYRSSSGKEPVREWLKPWTCRIGLQSART
jgi:hypothetical protein